MFTSVILPKPLSWGLFLKSTEPILGMKPYVLCKELQCKHVLSFAILKGQLLSENLFLPKILLGLNMAKIYKPMWDLRSPDPASAPKLGWSEFYSLPHPGWFFPDCCKALQRPLPTQSFHHGKGDTVAGVRDISLHCIHRHNTKKWMLKLTRRLLFAHLRILWVSTIHDHGTSSHLR